MINEQTLEQKAEELFNRYAAAHGMDKDDIRACTWYKAGLIDYTAYLLEFQAEELSEQSRWTSEKPELEQECLLLTASYIKSNRPFDCAYWTYNLFEITKVEVEEGWYWGILQDGVEWGDIADLKADLYQVVTTPKPHSK
jgi:hypothetical protein